MLCFTAAVTVSSIAVTGGQADDFAQTNNCGTSIAAGGTCSISVFFTPLSAGSKSATLTLTEVLHPEHSLVNLRVGLSDADGTWRAKGYVTNAANKRAVIYQDTTGYLSYPGITSETLATPPRTVDVRLSYRWKLRS